MNTTKAKINPKKYPYGKLPFGKLQVLNEEYRDSHGKLFVRCLCKGCNEEVVMRLDHVKSQGSTSKCKCVTKRPRGFEDLTGKVFGYLKVIGFVEKNARNDSMWDCLCTKCGVNHSIVARGNLVKKKNPIRMCRECAYKYVGEKNAYDLTGQRIPDSTITVIERDFEKDSLTESRVYNWKCKCDCGNEFTVTTSRLTGDDHITCCPECAHKQGGLAQRKYSIPTNDPFYNIYKGIIYRCTNPNDREYHNYGGRGIKVCDEWLNDFEKFKEDMYESYLAHKATHSYTSIERVNVNGNYCKENCIWADQFIQANNKRNTNYYNIAGGEYTIRDLINSPMSEISSYDAISGRLRAGYPVSQAIMDIDSRKTYGRNPLVFFNNFGYIVPDPYNNRH